MTDEIEKPKQIDLETEDSNIENLKDKVVTTQERTRAQGGRDITDARSSDYKGESSAAGISKNQTLFSEIRGKPQQNEEGNEEVCQILVEALNAFGANWQKSTTLQDPNLIEVNCEASNGGKTLRIQVTRIPATQDMKALAAKGNVSTETHIADAADLIKIAIEAKASKLAPSTKRDLLLAVSATQFLAYPLDEVLDSFTKRHGQWARSQGFKEIWIVGASSRLTKRLDSTI